VPKFAAPRAAAIAALAAKAARSVRTSAAVRDTGAYGTCVLTDYHVHLRADDLESTPAERFFTEENVDRYLEAASEAGIEELGVSEHIYRFEQALDIWDHPMWRQHGVDDLDDYCEFVRTTPLRLGVEMDYIPGREDRIASTLERRDFDYVIGSVHFVGERAVDDDEYDIWDGTAGADAIWRRYFEMIAEVASSGLYDILAHPDLVKVWGKGRPLPDRDPRFFYEPAIEAIADSGIAVEVSTAGLRKPVGELYPAPAFAEMCVEAGACFALSSDAHVPDQIGFCYDQAVETMREWGIRELAVFEGRSRRLEPLG
jgi:histidinol-phosphatase (PHP family)